MSLWWHCIAPAVDYEENPDIMPVMQTDDRGQPVGVTPTSFVVEFELLPEQEVNGLVDEYVHKIVFWIKEGIKEREKERRKGEGEGERVGRKEGVRGREGWGEGGSWENNWRIILNERTNQREGGKESKREGEGLEVSGVLTRRQLKDSEYDSTIFDLFLQILDLRLAST